jgi:GntR family transcriptional repressor for pyruvate dehydrogenase complex
MKIDPDSAADLSAQIAKAIRDAIVSGALIVDERLPSEAELADSSRSRAPRCARR